MQDPSWKDLGIVLERLGVSSELLWGTSWGSFGESDWVPVSKIRFFSDSGDVGGFSWLRMVSRASFWAVFGPIFGHFPLHF